MIAVHKETERSGFGSAGGVSYGAQVDDVPISVRYAASLNAFLDAVATGGRLSVAYCGLFR